MQNLKEGVIVNLCKLGVISSIVGLFVLMCVALSSCQQKPYRKPVVIVKTIVAKKEATETTYKYKYNVWKNSFYHQPDVHTVYYLIYEDGSYDKVSLGEYSIKEIDDTVHSKVYH